MKPEDLVGRRIRFLPRTRGCVYGLFLEGVTCHIVSSSSHSVGCYNLHLNQNGRSFWQHGLHLGRDFDFIDDNGELPYSWRN